MMKLILRQWKKEDAEQLGELANNKNIADNMSDQFPFPYTLQDAEKWIALNENLPTGQSGKKLATNFAIEVNNVLAGGCGMMIMDDVYRHSAEIGYWIAEPFWGKGIATDAVRILIEKIRNDHPEIIRVFAKPYSYNKASMKVLEKNGFYLEAIRKKAVIKSNVVMDDHVWVKLLDK